MWNTIFINKRKQNISGLYLILDFNNMILICCLKKIFQSLEFKDSIICSKVLCRTIGVLIYQYIPVSFYVWVFLDLKKI